MAHQTDMHVVKQDFETGNLGEKVVDPVCGAELDRKDSRHILFRPDETVYFCCRECKQHYLDPAFRQKKPA